MQPLLAFLAFSAFLGFRSHRLDSPVPGRVLLGACLMLTISLYSLRFL